MSTTAPKRDHRQEPTYWFAILDLARQRGDRERADEALRNLARLGVTVTFAPQRGREVASA